MRNDLDQTIALVAERHYGIFATFHLDDLGVSRGARGVRLDGGRWVPVHDGVFRIAGSPRSWKADLLAACWAGAPTAVASHRSAAALWELPAGRTDVVEVTCRRWRRTRHVGLVVHECTVPADEDSTIVGRIPCTTTARTLFDLARTLSPVMLDANIDNALRRELVSHDELVTVAARLATKGRPGGRRFRDAVETRSPSSAPAESVPERRLADMLVRHGLPEPRRQFEIRDAADRFVARVDLAYPEWKLVIEYDSVEHHTGRVALLRDSARRNAIVEVGFTVLTATAADLRDRGERLAASVRRIRARAA